MFNSLGNPCRVCGDGYAWLAYEGGQKCAKMPILAGYADSNEIKPPRADYACQYESDAIVGRCYSCVSASKLTASGSCVPNCPSSDKFSNTTKTCSNFDSLCYKRDFSNNDCLQCQERSYLKNDMVLGKVCQPCHTSCLYCTGPLATECSKCSPGFQLITGQCIVYCMGNQFYDAATKTCKATTSSCRTLSDSDTACTSLNDKTPIPLVLVPTTFGSCPTGKYRSASSCIACHSDCITCSGPSSSECTSCLYDQSPTSGACPNTAACTSNCQTCLSSATFACLEAQAGYYISHSNWVVKYHKIACTTNSYFDKTSSSCLPCHAFCGSCDGPGLDSCIYCADGISRYGSLCLNNPNNCNLYNRQGINTADLSCLDCSTIDPNCLQCIDSKCTYCINGFHPDSSGICVACAVNSRYCQQELPYLSLGCLNGFFHGEARNCSQYCEFDQQLHARDGCKACDPNCEQCEGSTTNCLSCTAGDILSQSSGKC